MRIRLAGLTLALACGAASVALAQTAQGVKGPDERMKADILVVVAHPDDEGGVTPYLARAIYEQHKRVAVVFLTRGGSGGNDYTREHGPALADIREQEAREACAKLGITNVWFLDGKDTASQNVLNSLANWGHGANLEALVRIVRLTRPDIMISWLPSVFVGENHGDHQASGVLATEAFDLAGDPAALPAQVTGATRRLEQYLENLTPWQPKKLFFFSDADDQKQFEGSGPAYSVREVSPSQKKPYWQLAMNSATPHLTQFPEDIHRITAMNDEQVRKFVEDPQHLWWTEPMTLIFGKATVAGKPTDDVFANLNAVIPASGEMGAHNPAACGDDWTVGLGGPWFFYNAFRKEHGLTHLRVKDNPEIGIKTGSILLVPLVIGHGKGKAGEVIIEVDAPSGWKVAHGSGKLALPEEDRTDLAVEIAAPDLNQEELKKLGAQEVAVRVSADGKPFGEVKLRVVLRASALPE
jgi:LmbE family N-acetylglucosaminyl deacetylase